MPLNCIKCFSSAIRPNSENFATSDQVNVGSPFANGSTLDPGAQVGNGSYVSIDSGSSTGSVNSNNNINSSFTFKLDQTTGITLEFAARAYLDAFVSGLEIAPGFASAAYSVEFGVFDLSAGGVRVFKWSPGTSITGGMINSEPFSLKETVATT